jgi:hypothetical protein
LIRESDIERYFKREVEKHGGLVWKFVSPGQAGVPDRVVLMPGGKVVFAEIKAPGKKPRPLQLAVIEKMARLGITTWVIDSRVLVQSFIEQYQKMGCLK